MSQNSNTLLLFFENDDAYTNCLKLFKQLEAETFDKAESFGIEISQTWNDDWFNHSITSDSQYIRIYYDTSVRCELPLSVLHQLFSVGLEAACLEVFYDQVGEFGQYYFLEDQLVEKASVYKKYTQIENIVDEQFECDSEDLDEDGYSLPSLITKLISDREKQLEDSNKMVDALMNLSKASQESGENPIELLKNAMILRAAAKGLLQAFGFGVITVLLFKGIWLWICTAIILGVILPLVYVNGINKEFGDDIDEEDKGDDLEDGETAC